MQGQFISNLFFRNRQVTSLGMNHLLGLTLGKSLPLSSKRSLKQRVGTMEVPIGYDNFKEVVDNQLDFVDKSLFIKEIIDNKSTKAAVFMALPEFPWFERYILR